MFPLTRSGSGQPESGELGSVQADGDVTPDSGGQVDLGLQVQLETDHQCRGLQISGFVGGPFEETACV